MFREGRIVSNVKEYVKQIIKATKNNYCQQNQLKKKVKKRITIIPILEILNKYKRNSKEREGKQAIFLANL